MVIDTEPPHARAVSSVERGRLVAKFLLLAPLVQRLMYLSQRSPHYSNTSARALVGSLLLLLFLHASPALAQKRFTERYPARKNVRLQLINRSGTITVEAWNKNEVRVTVEADSPTARVTPEVNDHGVFIDVVRDNRNRPDVGDVNFRINVPVNTMVDLETKRGNITVRGVEGALMRAHVTSEGDIELAGIRASTVVAENTVGNIVFDAELLRGGTYELRSTQGDISIRISANSGFRLMGLGRDINLGPFGGMGDFRFFGEKRKVVGQVGEGGATLHVNNQRGTITFMRRN